MTHLQKLQAENDIQKYLNWSMPDKIEEIFLTALEDKLENESALTLIQLWRTGKLNPKYRGISNGLDSWNTTYGAQFLASLANAALKLESEKNKNFDCNDEEFRINAPK